MLVCFVLPIGGRSLFRSWVCRVESPALSMARTVDCSQRAIAMLSEEMRQRWSVSSLRR
jgi:hypothetical protein